MISTLVTIQILYIFSFKLFFIFIVFSLYSYSLYINIFSFYVYSIFEDYFKFSIFYKCVIFLKSNNVYILLLDFKKRFLVFCWFKNILQNMYDTLIYFKVYLSMFNNIFVKFNYLYKTKKNIKFLNIDYLGIFSLKTINNFFFNFIYIYNFFKTILLAILLMLLYFIYTVYYFQLQFIKQLSV
eukprot:GHVR01058879.1.p1 GENE.GHVR01058879.1~~GHVR01058879.1.p1  ORF type:complete len:183 (-),score=12.98 GHVR01058879.1:437-985(-)